MTLPKPALNPRALCACLALLKTDDVSKVTKKNMRKFFANGFRSPDVYRIVNLGEVTRVEIEKWLNDVS